MENKSFKILIILAIAIITLTAIGKYYEVQQYKKSIENLELEHEILLKRKNLLENGKN
ncbi:hypothetical protein CAPN008_21790 [Capnocytophaga canis]|uniref:hypothetical protein n=1 Tax=Capnocytophaga canis TaxID=1848903 RepID=UPI001ACE9649|nr:hypothetical protein [Capnocytophaga canis]GIM62129.1 hypothetical protein CAPN008_21790 [Capnocytophaga canis]